MTFIVATNVIASQPPERRPTGTPHARAKNLFFSLFRMGVACFMSFFGGEGTIYFGFFGGFWMTNFFGWEESKFKLENFLGSCLSPPIFEGGVWFQNSSLENRKRLFAETILVYHFYIFDTLSTAWALLPSWKNCKTHDSHKRKQVSCKVL